MYSSLYLLSGLAFVGSVVAYSWFCIELSRDIRAGRIVVRLEAEPKKN